MNNKLYKLGLSVLTLALVFAVFCGMFCGCASTPANPDIVITVHDGDNGLLELEYTVNEDLYRYNYSRIGYMTPDSFEENWASNLEKYSDTEERAKELVEWQKDWMAQCMSKKYISEHPECLITEDDICWVYVQIIVDPEVPYTFVQEYDNTVLKVSYHDSPWVTRAYDDVLLAMFREGAYICEMVDCTKDSYTGKDIEEDIWE